MGSINCLVTDIIQNVFLCVQQEKEIHTSLKQLDGEYITEFSFISNLFLQMPYLN